MPTDVQNMKTAEIKDFYHYSRFNALKVQTFVIIIAFYF